MKKILIIGKDIVGFGGLETVVRNFIININRTNEISAKLVILGANGNDEWCKKIDYEVVKLSKKFKKINRTYKIARILKKEKPDFIICLHHQLLPHIYIAKKLTFNPKVKVFYWPHSNLDFICNTPRRREEFIRCIPYSQEFLAISSGIKDQFVALGIIAAKSVHLIYNPLVRQQHVIPKSKKSNQFIYVGRLVLETPKRLKDMVDAFALIKDDYLLKIIGDGDDRQQLIDYIKSKGLEDKIKVSQGWVANPWSVVDCVDAFVFSSDHEGLPMVLGEALSYGVPCVSSDCITGPRDFIEEGVNGYLYPPLDVEAFKDKILNIMQGKHCFDPEVLKQSVSKMYEDNYYKRVFDIFS